MRVTIGKFQELYAISQLGCDELDKSILFVQTLTGKTEAEVLAMSTKKFNKVCAKVRRVFDFDPGEPKQLLRAGRRRYMINYDLFKVTGRYVEVSTFSQDIIPNLHKIMASITQRCRWSWKKFRIVPIPYDAKKHEQYADDMLDADFEHAYNSAVFFWAVYARSMKTLHPYLIQKLQEKGLNHQISQHFLNSLQSGLDGFTPPKWCQN
jgi:muconolactone delta-isomerase